MGRRGPAPKPKALKLLQGTHRADREATNAPEPEPGIPEIPDGWGDVRWGGEAVAEFYRITPALKGLGLLTKVDRAAILAYCDAWGRWCHWRGKASEAQDDSTEKRMNRAFDDLRQMLQRFGLSPADRTRVTSLAGKQQDRNPFEEFKTG